MRATIVLLLLSFVIPSITSADEDTLRDLGSAAAPGEIPKWDGTQWRNAHDNITTVNAGAGLSGAITNGVINLGVVFGTNGTSNVAARVDHVHAGLEAARPPVGAVVAWLKSYANTPTNLPSGWVECNGQTLNDTDSVYNGQTIPNMNGSSRVLKGGATSGATSEADFSHQHTYTYSSAAYHSDQSTAGSGVAPTYTVVWIMRIK